MSAAEPIRIAMWSGPRNISTAMMRAWENRPDAAVVDEPLYAFYLQETGFDHPGREAIINRYPTDWRVVVDALTGPVPDDRPIFYQKHMTHHMLPAIDLGWLDRVVNCFLIREPREVIASYTRVRPHPTLDDIGFPRQVEIFHHVRARFDPNPPVLDSRDVLENPRRVLTRLCERIGVPFTEGMLSWPAGRRESDGIWAPHWYAAVEKSTGFQPYRPQNNPLAEDLGELLAESERLYAEMAPFRLR